MRKDEITKLERHFKNSIEGASDILQLAYNLQYNINVCHTLYAAKTINYLQFGQLLKLIVDEGDKAQEKLIKILLIKRGMTNEKV